MAVVCRSLVTVRRAARPSPYRSNSPVFPARNRRLSSKVSTVPGLKAVRQQLFRSPASASPAGSGFLSSATPRVADSPVPFEELLRKLTADTDASPLFRPRNAGPPPSPVGPYVPSPEWAGLRFIGRGSFGFVVAAKRASGRKVAVKVTFQPLSPSVGEQNAVGLVHPHVVHILQVTNYQQQRRLVVMEYGGSRNLQQVLNDPLEEISTVRRLDICHQVASGLAHCHQRDLLHLDLKPANVVLTRHGCCRLGDFSSSRLSSNLPSSGKLPKRMLGTVAYTAPELFKSEVPSNKADIYSFGIIMWQILTRSLPFWGEDAHVVIYKVVSQDARPEFQEAPNALEAAYSGLARTCWDRHPDRRPPATELVAGITNLQSRNAV